MATPLESVSAAASAAQSRTGAVAIVQAMHASNIEMVFGYSGGGTGNLIHELATTGLRNMNARTEVAGAWMSYGYNRIRGRAAWLVCSIVSVSSTPVRWRSLRRWTAHRWS